MLASRATYVLLLVVETSPRELPSDVGALHALILRERIERDRLIAQRDEEISQHKESIAALEHKLRVWGKMLFGPRTEKRTTAPVLPAGQTWLPFADLVADAQRLADSHGVHGSIEVRMPAEIAPTKGDAKRRSEFPAYFPRVRTKIEVAEADRICCGKPMEEMGVELSKKLERVETSVVHEIARTKYCCRTCQMQVLTAPAPVQPLSKALLGPNWLASLAVERFGNHMPYYRLEKKYESEGLALSRTVLCRSTIELAKLFEPVYQALREEVTGSDVGFADETPVNVQKSKTGGPGRGWMWLYADAEGDCFFDYSESRGRDSPTRVLANFKGALHDDGYCVYESALDPAKVVHVACWAHARRKYDQAKESEPVLASEALDWIGKLYAIDGAARKAGFAAEERGRLRREHAPAILSGFKDWLEVRRSQVLPEGALGKAIRYTLGRWEALCRFLDDGRFELDNNRAERALRPIALGRKNWIQLGNEVGGHTAAVFASLIGTCKGRGIDPKVYVHDASMRLAEGEDPARLTPREWQARFSAEVAERRNYALALLLGKLDP